MTKLTDEELQAFERILLKAQTVVIDNDEEPMFVEYDDSGYKQ